MEEQVKEKKKMKGVKLLVGVGALSALLYAGDKLNVMGGVSNGYNSAKERIVDIFTRDVGEVASELVEKLNKYQNGKYSNELENAIYVATNKLSLDEKQQTVFKLIKDSDDNLKLQVFKYSGDLVGYEGRSAFVKGHIEELNLEDALEVSKLTKSEVKEERKKIGWHWYDDIWQSMKDFYSEAKKKVTNK